LEKNWTVKFRFGVLSSAPKTVVPPPTMAADVSAG
jgi:hypothetical protein